MISQQIEHSIITTYRSRIWSKFAKGVRDYELIQENDKIAVCISGGKDSMILAKCLQEMQKHGKVKFELEFLCMDPGYSEVNLQRIKENAQIMDIPLKYVDNPIFDYVKTIEQSPCYLCARMRRGALYKHAQDLGCNKIALGHHYDDVIETILMGMLYGGQIQTMMPKLHSTNYADMELIRPFYLVREEDIISFANSFGLNFLRCACKFTEESQRENNSKRKEIKQFIKEYHQINPFIEANIFKSVADINLTTILGYHDDKIKYSFLDDYDTKEKQ